MPYRYNLLSSSSLPIVVCSGKDFSLFIGIYLSDIWQILGLWKLNWPLPLRNLKMAPILDPEDTESANQRFTGLLGPAWFSLFISFFQPMEWRRWACWCQTEFRMDGWVSGWHVWGLVWKNSPGRSREAEENAHVYCSLLWPVKCGHLLWWVWWDCPLASLPVSAVQWHGSLQNLLPRYISWSGYYSKAIIVWFCHF